MMMMSKNEDTWAEGTEDEEDKVRPVLIPVEEVRKIVGDVAAASYTLLQFCAMRAVYKYIADSGKKADLAALGNEDTQLTAYVCQWEGGKKLPDALTVEELDGYDYIALSPAQTLTKVEADGSHEVVVSSIMQRRVLCSNHELMQLLDTEMREHYFPPLHTREITWDLVREVKVAKNQATSEETH